jgi:hypothetical protein
MYLFAVWNIVQKWKINFHIHPYIQNIISCFQDASLCGLRLFSILQIKWNTLISFLNENFYKQNYCYIVSITDVGKYGTILKWKHYDGKKYNVGLLLKELDELLLNKNIDNAKEFYSFYNYTYVLSNFHFIDIQYERNEKTYPINLHCVNNYYIVGNTFDNKLFAHYLYSKYPELIETDLDDGFLTIIDQNVDSLITRFPFKNKLKITIDENNYHFDTNITEE